MKTIQLTNGLEVIVDDEDFDWLSKWKWSYCSGYAQRITTERGKRVGIYMHRALLKAEKGTEVDHINKNPLDNRKENLRLCSRTDNNRNTGVRSDNKSGYRGVYQDRKTGKWHAKISVNSKDIWLGLHERIEGAAIAYNQAAIKHHGAFASLNTLPV